jgi:hypothetical protein
MDDFEGSEFTILRPGATAVVRTYEIEVCSSATANDGHIPYGRSVSSVAVTSYKSSTNAAVTDLINGTPTVAANIVTVKYNYPSTSGTGFYELKMLLTLDDSSVVSVFFEKIRAVNEQA